MMIEWKHCKIQIRTTIILSDITLILQQGESLGIIGANGSCKTILAKAMSGLLQVTGEVKCAVRPAVAVYVSFQSEFTLKHDARTYRQQR